VEDDADGKLAFVKSSFCHEATCLEVARAANGFVVLRVVSSTMRNRSVTVTDAEWSAFISGVKRGDFDCV